MSTPMGSTGLGMGSPTGSKLPRGYRAGSMQQFTPQQMQLHQSNFDLVGPDSQLRQMAMGQGEGFKPYEDYANRQFQEFTGQNASRFSGLGMGARRGSGFQNMQTQGAQDFATQLAMQRQQLQRQALMDLKGLSSDLLGQSPYENFMVKKQQPAWKQFLLGINERGQDLAQTGVKMAASFI